MGIKRKSNFSNFMKKHSAMGIAIDNHCAIAFIDDKFKVISLKKDSHAYRVYREKDKVYNIQIPEGKNYLPVSSLYMI